MRITDMIRSECARVADAAQSVRIRNDRIAEYADSVSRTLPSLEVSRCAPERREALAAYWITLDAINFGSGWFPTLRKQGGATGYRTVAGGLKRQFEDHGPWSPAHLSVIAASELAEVFGQDADHELMSLFAASLRDLGTRITEVHGGSFAAVGDMAGGSAVQIVETLASWDCYADTSFYAGSEVPFLKRAQIAAADLHRAGVIELDDLAELTMFADNLVPHVLRLDGLLDFSTGLVARIERGDLLEHGSPEEVEIRACALQTVELLVAASPAPTTAMQWDEHLWHVGQQPAYKALPRHRSRCTAY